MVFIYPIRYVIVDYSIVSNDDWNERSSNKRTNIVERWIFRSRLFHFDVLVMSGVGDWLERNIFC
jgi:hypothetical protein